MARTHAVVVLATIALGTGLWFWASQPEPDAPPLPEVQAPAATDQPRAIDGATARSRVEPTVSDATPAPSHAAADATPANGTAHNVTLLVYDLNDHTPLPAFTWQFVGNGSEPQRGSGENGRADLRFSPSTSGQLLVESPLMEAHTRRLDVPSADMPPLQVDVFLPRRAAATGVTLVARDTDGAAVPRLRLDLWLMTEAQPFPAANTDPTEEPLWKRIGEDAEGLFVLPTIVAGRYVLRAQPIDADGWAKSLQPKRFQFAFAGHEAVPLDARFVYGHVLRIEANDDGGPVAQFTVSTNAAGATASGIWWQSRDRDGRTVVARDTVMLPGRVESLLALPPAYYELQLRAGDRVLPTAYGPLTFGVLIYRVGDTR